MDCTSLGARGKGIIRNEINNVLQPDQSQRHVNSYYIMLYFTLISSVNHSEEEEDIEYFLGS